MAECQLLWEQLVVVLLRQEGAEEYPRRHQVHESPCCEEYLQLRPRDTSTLQTLVSIPHQLRYSVAYQTQQCGYTAVWQAGGLYLFLFCPT